MNPLLLSQILEFVDYTNKNRLYGIKGKAGTGKTQIIKEAVAALDRKGYKVAVLVPTNKAAIVLKKRGINAKTIHSQLYHSKILLDDTGTPVTRLKNIPITNPLKPKEFLKDSEGNMMYNTKYENVYHHTFSPRLPPSTILIIDESSMVGAQEWKNLLEKSLFKIIAVGDVNQLEPVTTREGDIRKAIDHYDPSESKVTPGDLYDQLLEEQELQRQYGNYFIKLVVNWEELENKRTKDTTIKNIFESLLTDEEARWPVPFIHTNVAQILEKTEVDEELTEWLLLDADIVIAHQNITTNMLNNKIRELKYPLIFNRLKGFLTGLPHPGVGEPLYVDDTYSFSDDTPSIQKGEIITIINDGHTLDSKNKILYADVKIESSGAIYENLPIGLELCGEKSNKKIERCKVSFGYAITAHKAQGSQWGKVLVWDDCKLYGLQKKRWRYTACTRSVDSLAVIIQGKN